MTFGQPGSVVGFLDSRNENNVYNSDDNDDNEN